MSTTSKGTLPVTWTQIVLLAQELLARAESAPELPSGADELWPEEALRLASMVLRFRHGLDAGPIRARDRSASSGRIAS